MTKDEIRERINRDPLRAPYLRDILPSALLFLAGRASLLGMFPFGTAFFAACFDKSIAYIGITVLAIALMTCGARFMLIKYLVAALVFWIFTRLKRDDKIVRDAAACGGSTALGGLVFLLYNFTGIYDILILFVEGITAGFMYVIFLKAQSFMQNRKKRTRTGQDELISIAVSAGVFITGLSGITIANSVDPADILSVYAVLCIALNTTLAAAGSGGLCLGFLASMSSPSAIVMMGIFGICALFANLLKSFGSIGVALGFIGGSSIALLYAGNSIALPVTVPEVVIGASLFLLTPKKIHNVIGAFFAGTVQLEELRGDVRVKEYLTMRLEKAAQAFTSLEECFESASEKRLKTYNKDAAALFDETADRVCEDCPNAPRCWQNDFTRTYKSIMLLLETVETKGILGMDNIPEAFREKCIRAELFVMEFNHVYELYKKNLIRMGEAVSSRDLVARQYREVAALMNDMAGTITSGFEFRESAEEEIVSEFDKLGITVYEVNVVENGQGRVEVYLNVGAEKDKGLIARTISEVLATPMAYDTDASVSLMRFVSKARYSVEIGIRQRSRDYTEVSGDCIDSFTAENYKHYVIISDGMGSGRRAMLESHITLRLLREFLMSGFGVSTAVDMINSALCLKLDYECFSTVDLLCVDLMTGICEFYKIGSARSVIMRGNNVETVFSVSLPVGMIAKIRTGAQSKRLTDGDVIVMMSDGVSEAGNGGIRNDWIKKEIQKPFELMDDMAEAIIEEAVKKSRDTVMDDMTVAALRLVEN